MDKYLLIIGSTGIEENSFKYHIIVSKNDLEAYIEELNKIKKDYLGNKYNNYIINLFKL